MYIGMTRQMIGFHAARDVKGGFPVTLQKMHKIGCKCIQVVVGSTIARMSEATFKKYMAEAKDVSSKLKELDMQLFVHSPYTLNFAKDPKSEVDGPYWIEALWKILLVCDAMGAVGCVLHMGKAVSLPVATAKQHFYDNLVQVINRMKANDMHTKIIIETSAGQGTELYPTLSSTLDPLVEFFDQFTEDQRRYMGLCVDTCHIYAAGYDISTTQAADQFWSEFEEKIGLQHLTVVHMNDSVKALGSRVDRHAGLETGKIGLEGLTAFAKKGALYGIPLVLETPTCFRDIIVLRRILDDTYDELEVDMEIRDRMFVCA